MRAGPRAAAWAGLGAGAGALAAAGVLLHRVLGVAREIGRYVDDVDGAVGDIRRNTDAGAELVRLRRLTAQVRATTAGPAPAADGRAAAEAGG